MSQTKDIRERTTSRSTPLGLPDLSRQLCAGGDLELGEDAVQVRADGPRREVEPFPDLPVGQALGGEPGDLQFLRRQHVLRAGPLDFDPFAGRAQLGPGLLGPAAGADEIEGELGRPQRRPRRSRQLTRSPPGQRRVLSCGSHLGRCATAYIPEPYEGTAAVGLRQPTEGPT
jgi:hypothetical protein